MYCLNHAHVHWQEKCILASQENISDSLMTGIKSLNLYIRIELNEPTATENRTMLLPTPIQVVGGEWVSVFMSQLIWLKGLG